MMIKVLMTVETASLTGEMWANELELEVLLADRLPASTWRGNGPAPSRELRTTLCIYAW